MGSCGARSIDSDYVVALSTPERNNGHCFHHIHIACECLASTMELVTIECLLILR